MTPYGFLVTCCVLMAHAVGFGPREVAAQDDQPDAPAAQVPNVPEFQPVTSDGTPVERTAKMPTSSAAGQGDTPDLFEIRFTDGGLLKVKLLGDQIELASPYGKVAIPVAEIRAIDFATRLPDEESKRIAAAIGKLGNDAYKIREEGSKEIRLLGAAAYSALRDAIQSEDREVKRRAQELLEILLGSETEEALASRKFDVVETEHSKIAGLITTPALQAATSQFGELKIKLTDARSLRLASFESDNEKLAAVPDPGNLTGFQQSVGQTMAFTVTGSTGGFIWGTDIYTLDSSLATAAVHAGVVLPGQSGVVRVKILGYQQLFHGMNRNGVASFAYGPYHGGYKIMKPAPR